MEPYNVLRAYARLCFIAFFMAISFITPAVSSTGLSADGRPVNDPLAELYSREPNTADRRWTNRTEETPEILLEDGDTIGTVAPRHLLPAQEPLRVVPEEHRGMVEMYKAWLAEASMDTNIVDAVFFELVKYDWPIREAMCIAWAESKFDLNAVSPTSDYGLFQINKGNFPGGAWWHDWGVHEAWDNPPSFGWDNWNTLEANTAMAYFIYQASVADPTLSGWSRWATRPLC